MRRSELERLRAALDEDAPAPRPGFAASVLAARPEPRRRSWEWAMGVTAIALVFAMVGGLVYFGRLKAQHDTNSGPQTKVAVSNANFKCTLPLVVDGTPTFISFPDGKVTTANTTVHGYDPYSRMLAPLTFDHQAGRWLFQTLPVRPGDGARREPIAVSPDGRSYAYLADALRPAGATAEIVDVHVRELASNRDNIVYTGLGLDPDPFINVAGILAWTGAGIYVGTIAQEGANPDLYLIDPDANAAPRRLGPNPPISPYRASPNAQRSLQSAYFTRINGDYAWGYGIDWMTTKNPDGSIEPGSLYIKARFILRMDLRNGIVDTWYTDPAGRYATIADFDSRGHPLLLLDGLSLLKDRNQVEQISTPSILNDGFVSDAHGVWMGGAGVLWLYTPSGNTIRVAVLPSGFFPTPPPPQKLIDLGIPDPTSYPNIVQPAGACR